MVFEIRVMLSTALSTKRLYFGIPVGASEFWIAEDAWMAVLGKVDQAKLKVLVSVFGRETPLELPFDNVAKL